MLPRLDDPRNYRDAIDALAKKWSARGGLERLEVSGITLFELRHRSTQLAKLLAKTVGQGTYEFSPLSPMDLRIDGKRRTLYRPNLLDRIVLTVAARYLSVASEPMLLPNLHSYRKGHSALGAIAALAGFLKEHRGKTALYERGCYVLHRDVKRYGESIDTGPDSSLWSLVARAVQTDRDVTHRELSESLLRAAICQPVLAAEGTAQSLPRGVPTGSPIQTPCANLFLLPLDELGAGVGGGFYSRFGDDILFCHPDPDVVAEISRSIDALLESLGLSSKLEKQLDLYFNGAGRRSSQLPSFRPTNRLEYLGLAIDFHGQLGMKLEKARRFQRELFDRLKLARDTLGDADRELLITTLCDVARSALGSSESMAVRDADFLRHLATNRAELRDFDYRLARGIAELVTGRRGPRAFRELPYRRLRGYGLPSLVAARHRSYAARQT